MAAGAIAGGTRIERAPSSLWRDAARRFARNKLAMAGLVGVIGLVGMAIFAPQIAPYHYAKANYSAAWQFPNPAFPMGTDGMGRDFLSRIIYGARVSITVGVFAQLLAFAIGVPFGAISGLYGGKVDYFMMRVVDVAAAFPRLLFAILIMTLLGSGLSNILIAIAVTGWIEVARLTRGQILSLREKDFIMAAVCLGADGRRIVTSHLLPNCLTPLTVSLTLGIPRVIFTEAGLSFLGLGVNPPDPSWGQMVGESIAYIRFYWYLALFPAVMIGLTMLAFTLMGDGLRDALDPSATD
ncbi:MAG: ABC transporter permease [Chloroflexi bacterium]|nr:ABC transporter permease [Chloroflexota bacterium]MCL5107641.1 ABC transporter permease [Chloroflexota bacterium]